MNLDPLFSNPPAFVLLAVALALSAYLRQLDEAREHAIDEIEMGHDAKFPSGAPHTERKLEYLQISRQRLNIVAHVMIWLTIFVTLRLTAVALVKVFHTNGPVWLDSLFRWFDLTTMIVLLILFVGLYFMHNVARSRNAEVRTIRKGFIAGVLSSSQAEQNTSADV